MMLLMRMILTRKTIRELEVILGDSEVVEETETAKMETLGVSR